jgi:recombination protein RecA
MERTKPPTKLSDQMRRKVANDQLPKQEENEGNFDHVVHTGSTLLDLAISGKRIRGGGIPAGVLIEAFGPSQSGKTALLCETAGHIERMEGQSQFHDPESRLDKEFGRLFGMNLKSKDYYTPDTVTEVFKLIRAWKPVNLAIVNGIFADSLTALSTDMEMENEEGDKMGGRRAKEFSEQLRKTCRLIKRNNYIMMCSNQIRQNMDGSKFSPKFTTPGGEAIKFYSSIRLKFGNPKQINKTVEVAGKEVEKVIGIRTEIEVIKSVDDPYRKAYIYIIYDYGIDDIRANLQYIKDYTNNTQYKVGDQAMGNSLDKAIKAVEHYELEQKLREQVIDLWEEIEEKFKTERKPKR